MGRTAEASLSRGHLGQGLRTRRVHAAKMPQEEVYEAEGATCAKALGWTGCI